MRRVDKKENAPDRFAGRENRGIGGVWVVTDQSQRMGLHRVWRNSGDNPKLSTPVGRARSALVFFAWRAKPRTGPSTRRGDPSIVKVPIDVRRRTSMLDERGANDGLRFAARSSAVAPGVRSSAALGGRSPWEDSGTLVAAAFEWKHPIALQRTLGYAVANFTKRRGGHNSARIVAFTSWRVGCS